MKKNQKMRSVMFGAISSMLFDSNTAEKGHQPVLKSHEELLKDIKDKENNYRLMKGLKKYYYGEKFVWARNQKNADRKAKNSGLIWKNKY